MFTKNIVSSCLTPEEIRPIKHIVELQLLAFTFISICFNSFQFKTAKNLVPAIEHIFGACDTVLNLRDEGKEMHRATT